MRTRPLFDIVAFLARLGIGVVFLAHGWQKIQVGVTATSNDFDRLRVPAPTAAAIYATFVELLGGVALILGIALPVTGLLLFLDMAGAFVFVHAENGIFLVNDGTAENGFELVLVLGVASLLFAAGGGGRFTVDRRLFPRRATPPAPRPPDSAAPAVSAAPIAPAAAPVRPAEPGPGPGQEPEAGPSPGGGTRGILGRLRPGRASGRAHGEKASGGTPATAGRATEGTPEKAEASAAPSADTTAEEPADPPRLVSSIVEDTSGDVLVAGRRKRRSTKKPAAEGDAKLAEPPATGAGTGTPE